MSKYVWTQQPPIGTLVNTRHWAGSSCIFAYNNRGNYDGVRGLVGSSNPAKRVSPFGEGANFTTTGISVGTTTTIPTKPFTILAVTQLISWGGQYTQFIRYYSAGTGGGFVFGIDTAGRLDITFFGISNYPLTVSSLYDAALPVRTAAVTVEGTTATVYLDGKYHTQVTVGNITAGTTIPIVALSPSPHSYSSLPTVQVYKGSFKADQIRSLSENPWQIFAPQSRPVFAELEIPPEEEPPPSGDVTIDCTVANTLAEGIITVLDRTCYLSIANAPAEGINAQVGTTIDTIIANAIATSTNAYLDREIITAVADALATAVTYTNDFSLSTNPGNANAEGIISLRDTAIPMQVADANAQGIGYNLDKEIILAVANAIAQGEAYAAGSSLDCNVGNAIADASPYVIDYSIYANVGNATAEGLVSRLDRSLTMSIADATAQGITVLFDRSIPLAVADAIATGIIEQSEILVNCNTGDASAGGQPMLQVIEIYGITGNALAEGEVCGIGFTALDYDPAYKFIYAPASRSASFNPASRNNVLISQGRVIMVPAASRTTVLTPASRNLSVSPSSRTLVVTPNNKYNVFVVPKPTTNFIRN